VRPNSKKTPIFIDPKPASENREGRRMTFIYETSCSAVISETTILDDPEQSLRAREGWFDSVAF
jgi:hypothetical protein